MGRSKLTDEDRALIKHLSEQGYTYAVLAEKFGVSQATIMRTCRPETYQKHMKAVMEYNVQNSKQIYKSRKAVSKRYSFSFHSMYDKRIIEHLDKQENVQDYIRTLIENDLENCSG